MMREKLYWQEAHMRLDSLTVFRGILRDGLADALFELCRIMAFDPEMKDLSSKYYIFLTKMLETAEELGLKGSVLRKYFIHLFMNDENAFTLACERNEPVEESSLYKLAGKDVRVLQYLCGFDIKNVCDNVGNGEDLTEYVPIAGHEDPYLEEIERASTATDKLNALMWRYRRMGAGEMASFGMFRMGGRDHATSRHRLLGVSRADSVQFSDIVGLEQQKTTLKNNTEDFLAGKPANNMLLVGGRGSGKSSCVKALANTYADQGLRLIELRKDQAHTLPGLMRELAVRGKHFIIFMDDLSYESFETQYKYLKSLLEGSVEARPKNVLFYATSNRRHIIQESWRDREPDVHNPDGEIHAGDTVNEKLSLFDRFGITVTFPHLSKAEYLNITLELAKRRNLLIDKTFLSEQAMKWSLSQKSMSGRTARQFVDHIAGEMSRL